MKPILAFLAALAILAPPVASASQTRLAELLKTNEVVIYIDRAASTLTLYTNHDIRSARTMVAAVGRPSSPTPKGIFTPNFTRSQYTAGPKYWHREFRNMVEFNSGIYILEGAVNPLHGTGGSVHLDSADSALVLREVSEAKPRNTAIYIE